MVVLVVKEVDRVENALVVEKAVVDALPVVNSVEEVLPAEDVAFRMEEVALRKGGIRPVFCAETKQAK